MPEYATLFSYAKSMVDSVNELYLLASGSTLEGNEGKS